MSVQLGLGKALLPPLHGRPTDADVLGVPVAPMLRCSRGSYSGRGREYASASKGTPPGHGPNGLTRREPRPSTPSTLREPPTPSGRDPRSDGEHPATAAGRPARPTLASSTPAETRHRSKLGHSPQAHQCGLAAPAEARWNARYLRQSRDSDLRRDDGYNNTVILPARSRRR